ncbi:hypothetical protein COOONC_01857 [Cooperia oncophora]
MQTYAPIVFTSKNQVYCRFYDGTGKRRDWWKKEWIEQYNEKANCYVKQYEKLKIPKFNVTLSGKLTLPENLSDNEGVKAAYRVNIYLLLINFALDGLNCLQIFFLPSIIWL